MGIQVHSISGGGGVAARGFFLDNFQISNVGTLWS